MVWYDTVIITVIGLGLLFVLTILIVKYAFSFIGI